MKRLRRLYRRLLQLDGFRLRVAKLRWFYFVHVRRRLRTLHARDAGAATVSHNVKGMQDLFVQRSLALIRPLVAAITVSRPGGAIEAVTFPGVKVLSVGPRTEGELLNLVAHGFEPGCVRGLDLISYSPWIDLGDMHAMPYADNEWDAIVFGWTLAYSDNKAQAAREIVRVARPGAIVAIGAEYCCYSNEELIARHGYLPGSGERIWKLSDILDQFDGHIDRIFFQHDITPARSHEEAVALIAVFSIRK